MGAWYGSKATTGLSQAIVGLMRPHDTYIETHLGGGAIMKRKPPALRSTGIDLNARYIGTFCCDYEVELVHGCCHRFPADYPFEGSELVYSDPAYLMSTRKSQRRYRYHYSEADHEALLGLPGGLPCSVMISGYFSALYDRILEGCHSVSVKLPREACQRVNKSDNKTLTAAERRAVRKRYRTILTRSARSCPNSRRDRKGNADGSQSPSHATCTSASRSTKSPSCASQPTRTSASRIMPESRRSGCQRSRSRSRDASGPNSRPKPGAGSPVIWTQWRHSATILSSPSRSRSPEMPPQ